MRQDETGLLPALEEALKAADTPLDCHTLYDMAKIKKVAANVNRVSDYLGLMWRKGLLLRSATAKDSGSRARWAYEWKGSKEPKVKHAINYTPKILADRPSMSITEDGKTIRIETPYLIIAIQQK